MTIENNLELFKLNPTDRKVLFWMMDDNPQALRAWIDYIADLYKRKGTAALDTERLFREVIVEIPESERLDFGKSWRPKRILLVDDETIFNFLHRRMLELTGVTKEIHTTLNGIEAMVFLKENARNGNLPDVILLDLTMPVAVASLLIFDTQSHLVMYRFVFSSGKSGEKASLSQCLLETTYINYNYNHDTLFH